MFSIGTEEHVLMFRIVFDKLTEFSNEKFNRLLFFWCVKGFEWGVLVKYIFFSFFFYWSFFWGGGMWGQLLTPALFLYIILII